MAEQSKLSKFIGEGKERSDKVSEAVVGGPYKLPEKKEKDWGWVRIGDVTHINRETRNPAKERPNGKFTYIEISGVKEGCIKQTKKIPGRDAPSRARRVVHTNDVIMSTVRPYLKAFAIIPESYDDQICSTGFAMLSSRNNLLPRYLLYALLSDITIQQCNAMMIGAHYPALRIEQVSQIKIPLPPLEEQRQIVARIEEFKSKIEKAKKLKKIAKGSSEKVMQAALNKVFLKVKREEREQVKLGNLIDLANGKFITRKDLKSTKEGVNNIPIYGSNGIIGYGNRTLIDYDTLTIGRVGACGSVNFAEGPCWISDNAIYVKKIYSNQIILDFLYWLLKYCDLGKFAKKSAQPLITQDPILNMKIPLPSIEKQKKIVTYLDNVRRGTESLRILQRKTDEEMENLVPAILDKAFRGEL